MKEKTEKTYTSKENPIIDMTEQALKNCEEAMRCGFKAQEEAARRWTDFMFQASPTSEEWQNRFNNFAAAAKDLAPASQKRMEEMMDLVNKNSKVGTDLFKMAADAAQARSMAERQAAWNDLWTASVGAARSNAETLTQINNRIIDGWMEFVQKGSEAAAQAVKPAQAA